MSGWYGRGAVYPALAIVRTPRSNGDPAADPYEELEANLILHDLVSMTSEEQYRLASMRLQGYSIAETARSQGMSPKRVRKLLREMYQVYLKLYKD